MPTYEYPEPTALVAYRGSNPSKSVWEAIAQTSTPGTLQPTTGIQLINEQTSQVWRLKVDTDGSLLTTRIV